MPGVMNVTRDYLVPNDPRQVRLIQVSPEGQEIPWVVESAQKYEVSRQEIFQSGGQWSAQDVVFELPAAEIPNAKPVEGDTIREETGARWTVKESRLETFDTIWRCVCAKQRAS